MVGVVIVSENRASVEMLKTVRRIVGKRNLKGLRAIVIKSGSNKTSLVSKLSKAIKKLGPVDSVLLMSELYGSTQSNVCRHMLHREKVELICGYNLPMLIKTATLNQKAQHLHELVGKIGDAGKKYIKNFSR